ncbi:hypothetical protein [Devosia sp. RR2S18]|uniref:hypothetical protein n=1 Tax=Devosia rhizosphaerae TaxID=3049774 RepID=UPI002542634E|nr:hypothetical protein [Devosia sp. RR2S18]WIJ25269.1 hypothetical protein QOV41_00385 [Devosia sp. RR2S18]
MNFVKNILAVGALCAAAASPTFAQDAATPEGTWQDKWGTTFTFSMCGDGTQLCGVLNDIQGDSRTEENLAFVDQQVVQGNQVAPNEWKGNIALNGGNAEATVELVDPDTISITGCRGIFCSSIEYERVS